MWPLLYLLRLMLVFACLRALSIPAQFIVARNLTRRQQLAHLHVRGEVREPQPPKLGRDACD